MASILKKLISANKLWVGISAAVYSVLFFIVTGNLNLIENVGDEFTKVIKSTEKVVRLTKDEVFKECFTIGNIEIVIFIISIAILCLIFFKDKEYTLEDIVDDSKAKVKFFKDSVILLMLPITIGIIINFFISSILFVLNQEIISLEYKISYFSTLICYVYVFILALVGVGAHFMFQICVKSKYIAAVTPILVFESIIMIFGVTCIFVSGRVPVLTQISEVTSDFLVKYPNMFYLKQRVETLAGSEMFMTMLAIFAVALIFFAGTSRSLLLLNKNRLEKNFRFEMIRKVLLLDLIACSTIYLMLVGFILAALFSDDAFKYMDAIDIASIGSVVLIPVIYIGFEVIYKKRNKYELEYNQDDEVENIKRRSKNKLKPKISQDIDDIKNYDMPIEREVKIKVNKSNFKSKGIIKETVKTKVKEIDKEDDFFIVKKNDDLK